MMMMTTMTRMMTSPPCPWSSIGPGWVSYKQNIWCKCFCGKINATADLNGLFLEFFLNIRVYLHLFSALDEDSNLATSPMPDMDSDSLLGGPVDEEERWLDALEKGELDDNGELKKEVDESLLTARQVKKMERKKET